MRRTSPGALGGLVRSVRNGRSAMRRVVVTGLGMVTPLGCGVEADWTQAPRRPQRRVEGRSLRRLGPRLPDRLRGPARRRPSGTFNPDEWMEPKEQRKVDHFIVYGMAAARQALDDAGWKPSDARGADARTGVLIGSGIGGIGGIDDAVDHAAEKGPRRVSPFFIPGRLINLASRPGLDRATASRARTTPSSPPAPPAPTRSATRRG